MGEGRPNYPQRDSPLGAAPTFPLHGSRQSPLPRRSEARTSRPLAAPSLTGDMAAIEPAFMSWNGGCMRRAWCCDTTNSPTSSDRYLAAISAASKRSQMIGGLHGPAGVNWSAIVLHNVDGSWKRMRAWLAICGAPSPRKLRWNNARTQTSMRPRRWGVQFFCGCGKSRYRVMKPLSHLRLRYPDTRLSETGAPAPMRPSAGPVMPITGVKGRKLLFKSLNHKAQLEA